MTHEHTDHSRRDLDDPDDWHCHQKGNYEEFFAFTATTDRHDSDLLPPDTPEEILRPDRRSDPAHPDLTEKPGRFSIWRSPSLTFIRPRRASSASRCAADGNRSCPGDATVEPALRRICQRRRLAFHEAFCSTATGKSSPLMKTPQHRQRCLRTRAERLGARH